MTKKICNSAVVESCGECDCYIMSMKACSLNEGEEFLPDNIDPRCKFQDVEIVEYESGMYDADTNSYSIYPEMQEYDIDKIIIIKKEKK